MLVDCVWEHNGNDTLLYSDSFIGAYTRGGNLDIAIAKIPHEIKCYCQWLNKPVDNDISVKIVQEKNSSLNICDADSDVIFDSERLPLTEEKYMRLKELCLKSAQDFLSLYNSIPNKDKSALSARTTFYGDIPRTANEMYEHTKNVNDYYFGEIGVDVDNGGTIFDCRRRGFAMLEKQADFLRNAVFTGSFDEQWSVQKVLRRFVWHDRIHAKAMFRMARKTFDGDVDNVFMF